MFFTRLNTRSLLVVATALVAGPDSWAWAADDPAAATPAATPEAAKTKEDELLAVLRSDAPSADKAITCKQLAIQGSSAAVPDLAKLLPDEQLSSWARIAIEAIPGPEADAALRAAAESLQGRLAIGMINSIGVRRDAGSVELLTARLQDEDAEVASAAAVALGRIGNAGATAALTQALVAARAETRSAIAEGCVLCAEQLHAAGDSEAAVVIYDQVRAAELPQPRIIEATRGAILARKEAGLPLLLEQFRSPEKALFQVALKTAREFPGTEVDKALATEITTAAPDRAAVIIQAMADRPQTVILAAILKAAEAGPLEVRLSAINALSRVGDTSCMASLLKIAIEPDADLAQVTIAVTGAATADKIAIEPDADLAQASKATLAELPGKEVDSQIVALLPQAEGATYLVLLQLVGQRRIDAVALLQKALTHADPAVRSAALVALGETVALKNLSVLISQVVEPRHAADAPVAQQALMAASIRMPDREACAAELSTAINKTKAVPTKGVLLNILGAMGGTKALATIGAAANSKDSQLQDISSRLLGEWMTEDAAPVLLDLSKMPGNQFQIRALRGYIRIARQFVLPDAQRAEMCQKAFDASKQTAEKKLVLEILKRYPTVETLQQAVNAMQVADLKEDATQAVLLIAQKLGSKGVDVKEQLAKAGFEKVKLEIVKAEYGSGATQKDVTEILQKQVGDLPLVVLENASYNATFGGDPTPGSGKQLKIQYRINDKAGEISFAEDALIIFPMPK